MPVVYFQGHGACFDQYKHHLIDAGLFQEDEICKPGLDLDEIRYINPNTWNPFWWIYMWVFHAWRKFILNLPPVRPYWIAGWKECIGGQKDIDEMKIRAESAPASSIFYGVSRGALVVARYCCQPRAVVPKCIVLEGCPFSIQDVIRDRFGILAKLCIFIVECVTSYKQSQECQSWNWIQDIPLSIPLLLITSKSDTIVPAAHSERLFDALKAQNRSVYLLVLENVDHNEFATSSLFQETVPKFLANPTRFGPTRRIDA